VNTKQKENNKMDLGLKETTSEATLPRSEATINEKQEAIDRALLELAECTQTSIKRALNFRKGQRDRLKGLPCMSANGSYLDGWYDPDKQIPPSLTEAQVVASNLNNQAANTANPKSKTTK
jgi:hypothetical protein